MKIIPTLFTLIIGGMICLPTFSVQADWFKNGRDKHERSFSQDQQRDRNEKTEKAPRADKIKGDKPSREGQHKDEARQQSREQPRPADKKILKQPATTHDHKRATSPVKPRQDRNTSEVFDQLKRNVAPVTRVNRPSHRIVYPERIKPKYRFVRGPWYYTRFIRPFRRHYHPIGFWIEILPVSYVSIVVGGYPYYYYSGVYYQPYNSGYVVVAAPIGAFVTTLPDGFIAFVIGSTTYYTVNDTYYIWDYDRSGYVVVAKPAGADAAIEMATRGRLMVYPNKGQSEEQQAKDQYECHRWAVSQSGFDPTLEDAEYAAQDNDNYRRALAACLEGRDYTVK